MTDQTSMRLKALREEMSRENIELIALAPGSHMDWVAGFHPHPDERACLLLIGPEKEAFLMPGLNAEGSRAFTGIAFHCWSDEDGPQAALLQTLEAIGVTAPKAVALDETMRVDFALLLLDSLPAGTPRQFLETTLGKLRMRKDATEYQKLKMNALIADRAMQKAFDVITPGMTENQVATEIKNHFASEQADPQFWIVGAAGNGAFPHHSASESVIKAGDAIVIDIGGRRDGYPSDITRMAIVGEAPDGYDEVHAIVEKAVQAALAAARPGVMAKDVDAAARNVIADAGYGDYFVHRTGHGLGIDGHEPPFITATSEAILDEGMVFSIEPGIYLPGRFGIRLEEIVILRADGPEILSELPRDVKAL
ncbi:M24 family metallopeptidase [uncultured Cohaesibacter sp.]|uniref:M24 family metallopeptidase n=1 Tax=uncultured Cohaesibacter sp. TaxID=1002546 RepID=UPI00293176DB|nr:M24 family metallopeptidase [uncultured Cohaesibacter sp.]